ncbi:7-cyano-7-deazaguanine synthase QueC [Aliarcobacter cibarius]|jgi:7-cyano-7-deazaguanine synthase|uniref:7-cyano-7-deazaguanine synthase n=1 Tax=Aliarcobacter cibarius TaxID=255507 RepID=A0A7L5JMI9_9BACT|nr:7-cyano-7-deazaguanine synthase QueC [Aliarcobacter cibarius]QKJ26455.1 7-cyano-7-deazaguanine synthase [Aliarcobacter cibarius]TLT01942.1 7-cyano-7-deazaguanine synthase QueC [Aliarcobacter cibarius]TLT02277.1 7-cyano-7-deazaguanine synthase QueC [Aliarcobacter cibarius]TLT04708.1 7-cyano-7-deazaguanine synthase QueC [Aliarcobacter cibarius]
MINNFNKKAVVILSGGMDSTLSSYIAKNSGYELIAVHFNYGQRTQERELKAFRDICEKLNVLNKYEIDIPFFTQIGASALTDKTIDVPTSGIEKGIVPITYVPFRNGIFLSIASAIAEKEEASAIYIGVVEEDSSGYPDCSDNFIQDMNKAINEGTKEDTKIRIITPLVHLSKTQIVEESIKLNVPLNLTWSCYKEEIEACGVCDSCRLRLNGFKNANAIDPIKYKEIN